ncbi:MAG: hypothetical protein GF418_12625 [Chitinivibrionales bacterium]|nr:hypothetical protein [Chitinivibrionales bacterium]MBD3396464.1 hypothetical protein [Chitinivibrionales bacterium]
MHEVTADTDKNRLYVTLSGNISREEAERTVDAVVASVSRLRDGFDVINDLSELRLSHLSAAGTLRNVMDFLKSHHVGRVIRVAGRSRMGFTQFLRAAERFTAYRPEYARSREEAERMLER